MDSTNSNEVVGYRCGVCREHKANGLYYRSIDVSILFSFSIVSKELACICLMSTIKIEALFFLPTAVKLE